MGNPALPLKITASKHFDVVDRKRSCILGEPVVDVQMVLDGPVPDSVDAALTEVLGSPVSTFRARTSPEIAIGWSGACLRHLESNMTLPHIVWLESHLMPFTGPVVSQSMRHILQPIKFHILDPLPILHGIYPKRRPIVVVVACHLIVKFKLQEAISSNWKITRILGILVNACISVNSLTSDLRCNGICRFVDIWWLHELGIFPATVAGTAVVVLRVEACCEGACDIKVKPLLTPCKFLKLSWLEEIDWDWDWDSDKVWEGLVRGS